MWLPRCPCVIWESGESRRAAGIRLTLVRTVIGDGDGAVVLCDVRVTCDWSECQYNEADARLHDMALSRLVTGD